MKNFKNLYNMKNKTRKLASETNEEKYFDNSIPGFNGDETYYDPTINGFRKEHPENTNNQITKEDVKRWIGDYMNADSWGARGMKGGVSAMAALGGYGLADALGANKYVSVPVGVGTGVLTYVAQDAAARQKIMNFINNIAQTYKNTTTPTETQDVTTKVSAERDVIPVEANVFSNLAESIKDYVKPPRKFKPAKRTFKDSLSDSVEAVRNFLDKYNQEVKSTAVGIGTGGLGYMIADALGAGKPLSIATGVGSGVVSGALSNPKIRAKLVEYLKKMQDKLDLSKIKNKFENLNK